MSVSALSLFLKRPSCSRTLFSVLAELEEVSVFVVVVFDFDVVELELPDLADEADELVELEELELPDDEALEEVELTFAGTSASATARGTKYQNGTERTFTFPFTIPASGLFGYDFFNASEYWLEPVMYQSVSRTAGRTLFMDSLSA